jgi:hypothetical protein
MKWLWRSLAFTILIVSYISAPHLASAAPLQLGAPYGVVRAAFAKVDEVYRARQRVLEVRAPHFGGVVWEKADFTFNSTNHLASVTLSTTHDSFAHIKTLMADALAKVDAAPPGQEGLAQDAEGDVQIRICEGADGAITVTFQRTAI